jgi:hypothetical protein
MQDLHLFEYAVIRVVPMVEREEFMNVGVVLYCRDKRFLQARLLLPEARLHAFSPHTDIEVIKEYLCAFEQICLGNAVASPIARLDIASRFRWLTATRSTVVQTSKVHPGLCLEPAATLVRLYERLVL